MIGNHREAAYALLRVTLGVVFLFYGVGKFMGGIGNFASGMEQHFAGKLPSALVLPFAYALPFMEVIFGALILLGLFNSLSCCRGCYCSLSPSARLCWEMLRPSHTTFNTRW